VTAPLLEVRELAWTPDGADRPLWEGVSFRIEAAETVALKGQSGSGKSTLLRAVLHLERPDSGAVLWRGEAVTPATIRRFRQRVVYVHQSPVAIAPRVEENLAFPRELARHHGARGLTEKEQARLLERLGLKEIDGSRRFDELSVGEQQRVALVRCMTVCPEVLLLDEPTASLDDENTRRVEEFLAEYVAEEEERAALWITHDTEQRERLGARTLDLSDWLYGRR
jgi:putative ABC transport system ATP-binding protein